MAVLGVADAVGRWVVQVGLGALRAERAAGAEVLAAEARSPGAHVDAQVGVVAEHAAVDRVAQVGAGRAALGAIPLDLLRQLRALLAGGHGTSSFASSANDRAIDVPAASGADGGSPRARRRAAG